MLVKHKMVEAIAAKMTGINATIRKQLFGMGIPQLVEKYRSEVGDDPYLDPTVNH